MKIYTFFSNYKHFLRALIITLVFTCSSTVISQNLDQFREYKGYILDSEKKKPLPLADLIVTNTNISTISNSEGEFILKVPKTISENTITINYLGYKTKIISFSELDSSSNKIFLEEAITTLNSVDINTVNDAELLVRKALQLKGENYVNSNSIMTAFYRETIKKGNKNASLSEAVLNIYKQSYTSPKRDHIKLIKSRKKTNYKRLDTIAVKLQGGPFSCLHTDLMKYPQYVFTKDDFSKYEFSFGNSTQIDNKRVYVINFKQRPEYATPLYYGKLYIDQETNALASAIYNLNVDDRKLASKLFIRKKPNKVQVYPTEAAYRVNYRIKDGKWYYGYSNILLTFKVNWKNKLFNSRYTLQSEMAITDWNTNTSGILKPKNNMRPSIIMNDAASGFSDPEFWGEYNIIEPEKSIESAIRKIKKQLDKS